jgi:hypothetical protein
LEGEDGKENRKRDGKGGSGMIERVGRRHVRKEKGEDRWKGEGR